MAEIYDREWQLTILQENVQTWNLWRREHPEIEVNLCGAILTGGDLSTANLRGADLRGVNLYSANLSGADLSHANVSGAELNHANLSHADLSHANLSHADLHGANLFRANLIEAHLPDTNLSGADLSEADLLGASLYRADLRGADLTKTNCVATDFTNAALGACHVYGICSWDVHLDGATQQDLLITNVGQPEITVDTLEIAYFLYLTLNGERIRKVIDTVDKNVVLIVGRFTSERMGVLNGIRNKLRSHGYVPLVFDFEGLSDQNPIKMVSTLAHLARFVIADLTNAKSSGDELANMVPQLSSVVVQPIIQEDYRDYAMVDNWQRFPWVYPVYVYEDQGSLLDSLIAHVIVPAEAKVEELQSQRQDVYHP